jgi:hypothetical protein
MECSRPSRRGEATAAASTPATSRSVARDRRMSLMVAAQIADNITRSRYRHDASEPEH